MVRMGSRIDNMIYGIRSCLYSVLYHDHSDTRGRGWFGVRSGEWGRSGWVAVVL